MTLDEFRAEFCLPFTIFYDRHVPHVPLAQLESWFHSRFSQVQDSVCELPHARDFLEFCRAQGFRTFLLSTVHQDYFAVQSNKTGFHKYLDKPYLQVWDKRQKIHRILEENGLPPEETLFIGDMQHDIETAKHGGVHSCAVLTGYNTLGQLRVAEPDVIVEHLRELREILERNDMRLNPRSDERDDGQAPVATVGALIFDIAGKVPMIRTHKWSNLWRIAPGKGESGGETAARKSKGERHPWKP